MVKAIRLEAQGLPTKWVLKYGNEYTIEDDWPFLCKLAAAHREVRIFQINIEDIRTDLGLREANLYGKVYGAFMFFRISNPKGLNRGKDMTAAQWKVLMNYITGEIYD